MDSSHPARNYRISHLQGHGAIETRMRLMWLFCRTAASVGCTAANGRGGTCSLMSDRGVPRRSLSVLECQPKRTHVDSPPHVTRDIGLDRQPGVERGAI